MRPRFVFVGDIVRSAHISYFFDADIRWPGEFEEIPTDTSKLSTINASTFDGDWESYITDFATILPVEIDLLFHECVGYPGIHSPEIKDWILKQQVTAVAEVRVERRPSPPIADRPDSELGASRFAPRSTPTFSR